MLAHALAQAGATMPRLSASPGFLALPIEEARALLASPDLRVVAESHVYKAAVRWLGHGDRRAHTAVLLAAVRVLDPAFIRTRVCSDMLEQTAHPEALGALIGLLRRNQEHRTYAPPTGLVGLGGGDEMKHACVLDATMVFLPETPVGGSARAAFAGATLMYAREGEAAWFDPERQKWNPTAPPPRHQRRWSAANFDGRFVLTGGVDAYLSGARSATVYSPVPNTWIPAPPMHRGRVRHALVEYAGRLYALGGLQDDTAAVALDSVVDSVEALDTDCGGWVFTQSMPCGRYDFGAASDGTNLYVVGGGSSPQTAHAFDGMGWAAMPGLPLPMARCFAYVSRGDLFAIDPDTGNTIVFPRATGEWARLAPNADVTRFSTLAFRDP
jgi:hypothetical protein